MGDHATPDTGELLDFSGYALADQSDSPAFDPWIGIEYQRRLHAVFDGGDLRGGEAERLHFLGESFYSDPADPLAYSAEANLTEQVVRDWGDGRGRSRFFPTVLALATNGEAASPADVWSSIAYSNFVQDLLPGRHFRPNAAMWSRARTMFFRQLAITRPTILIVMGKTMWKQLPWRYAGRVGRLPATRLGEEVNDAWIYGVNMMQRVLPVLAVPIAHPASRGFSLTLAARRLLTARIFASNVLSAFSEDLESRRGPVID